MQGNTINNTIVKAEEHKIQCVVENDDDSSFSTITCEDDVANRKGKSNDDDDDPEKYFETIIEECKPHSIKEEEKPDFWKMISKSFEPPPKEVVAENKEEDNVGTFFKDLSERFNVNKEQTEEKLKKGELNNVAQDEKESNRQKVQRQQQNVKPNDFWKNLAKAINDPDRQKQEQKTKKDEQNIEQKLPTNAIVSEGENEEGNKKENELKDDSHIKKNERQKKGFWKVLAKAIIEPDKPKQEQRTKKDDNHSDQNFTTKKSLLKKEAHEKEIEPNNNAVKEDKERPKNLWSMLTKSTHGPRKQDHSSKNENDHQVRNKLEKDEALKQRERNDSTTEDKSNDDRNQELESIITKETKRKDDLQNIFEELNIEPLMIKDTKSNNGNDSSTIENDNENMSTSTKDLSQQIDIKKKENADILFQIDSIVSNAKEITNQKNSLSSNDGSEHQLNDGSEHQLHDEQHGHDFNQSSSNLFGSHVFENQDLPPSFTDDEDLDIAIYNESSSTKIDSIIEDPEQSNSNLFGSNTFDNHDIPPSFTDDEDLDIAIYNESSNKKMDSIIEDLEQSNSNLIDNHGMPPSFSNTDDEDLNITIHNESSNTKLESIIESNFSEYDKSIDDSTKKYDEPLSFRNANDDDSNIEMDNNQNEINTEIESILESSNSFERDQLTESKHKYEELYDSGEDLIITMCNNQYVKNNTNISQSKTINDEDKTSSTSFVSEIASSAAKLEMIDLTDSTCDEDKPILPSEKDELMESALEEKDSSLLKNEVKEKKVISSKECDSKDSSMATMKNSVRHAPPRFTPCMLCGMIKKFYWVQTPPQYS